MSGVNPAPGPAPSPPSFAAAVRFWFLLGCISFGGPAGQIAVMHSELVEKRRWIDETSFMRALNFCMVLPGPEAMQLAAWLGWRLHGMRGGIVAGALFILPASVLLAVLSWAYLRFGQLPVAAGVLFGLQAAVLGIVVHAARKIGGRVLKTPFALLLAILALLAIALTPIPFPLILLVAAMMGLAAQRWRPRWIATPAAHGEPGAAGERLPNLGIARVLRVGGIGILVWWLPLLALALWPGADSTAFEMGLFFSKAALVTVGGAYAVLPYVADQAVQHHGWLSAEQMMAGLGLAETTPGPLVLVLEFVGFVGGWQHPDLPSPMASALLCTAVTLWATFLPSFIFVLSAAPWIDRIGQSRIASAVLAAITAAVVGVVAHLALWFGWSLLADEQWPAIAFAIAIAATVYLGLARWHWPVAGIVVAAGVVGGLAQFVLPLGG